MILLQEFCCFGTIHVLFSTFCNNNLVSWKGDRRKEQRGEKEGMENRQEGI